MPDHSDDHRRLADLLVGFGSNLQPGEVLGVSTYVGMEEMTRAIARAGYERGAKWVDILWFDPFAKRERLLHADPATLDFVPPWMGQRALWLSEVHAARVSLTGSDPRAYDGLDPARTGKDVLPYIKEIPVIVNDRTTSWCAGPCPTDGWARLVHPDLAPEDAYEKLWEQIKWVCRLDTDDPIGAWEERMKVIVESAARLTVHRFDAIHLKAPNGTDLTVGLLPSSKWLGAEFSTVDGKRHYPNLPTEEIFTTPDPDRVDGTVVATMPLDFYGSRIEGIRLRFEGGRAVEIDADKGADSLRSIASKDDGANRLGELALVDKQGRIGPLKTIFYDTLLDENAASHIALGNAYSFPVEDEADLARINKSGIHVDFMIGTDEMEVDGIAKDGARTALLRGGEWQL